MTLGSGLYGADFQDVLLTPFVFLLQDRQRSMLRIGRSRLGLSALLWLALVWGGLRSVGSSRLALLHRFLRPTTDLLVVLVHNILSSLAVDVVSNSGRSGPRRNLRHPVFGLPSHIFFLLVSFPLNPEEEGALIAAVSQWPCAQNRRNMLLFQQSHGQ